MSKSFGSVRAPRDLSLDPAAGSVHALAGENGAGKSTLITTLTGVHQPGSGTVVPDGRPVRLSGPGEARDAGVAAVAAGVALVPEDRRRQGLIRRPYVETDDER